MRVVSFEVEDHDVADVVVALTDLGFTFGDSRTVTTTVLDTFDGRVHRAGWRLDLLGGDPLELVLSGDDVVPAHLAVATRPRLSGDLPPGPMRSRIAALIEVRALMPKLRVTMRRSTGEWRDDADKVVAVARIHEDVRNDDRPEVDAFTMIEVHPVLGYERAARRTVSALHNIGATESGDDTVTRSAASSGVDLEGFAATATIPLDPRMAAIEGFRAVLANLALAIGANWQGAARQIDPVFLHQLRIAVRRTRTVVGVAKSVLPPPVVESARDDFAWLASVTGTPRDLDVSLLEWEAYTDSLGATGASALEPVQAALERRCADAHRELEEALRSERATALLARWEAWLGEPNGNGDADGRARRERAPRHAQRPLGAVVAKRIERAHIALVDKGRLVGPSSPAEQVHDLRKDAKKMRYLLECFGALMPDQPRRKYLKRLKALQDNLGEYQDAEVHIALLGDIAGELTDDGAASDTIAAVAQLTKRLDQRRLAARARFALRFADYDSPATRRAFDALLESVRR